MDVADVLIAMENKPRKANRMSREFVESVDWELRKKPDLEASVLLELRNFLFMAVVRGVYVDADIGNLDIIAYVANAVVFRYVDEVVDDEFIGKPFVLSPEELRRTADNALFIAGFTPTIFRKKGEGLERDFFVFVGKSGYGIMSRIASAKTQHRRFSELSDNFRDYALALEHTAKTYLGH